MIDERCFLQDGWAVCRIFHKSTEIKKPNPFTGMTSYGEEELSSGSLPSLLDHAYSGVPSSSFVTDVDNEIRVSDGSFLYSSISPELNTIMNHVAGQYPMNPDQSMFYPHGQNNMVNNSYQYVQGQVRTPSRLFNQLGTMNNARQSKVEPNQSRSMASGPSQDTGLSADINTEISSSQSKSGLASVTTPFENLMNPFFSGSPNSDELGISWDYL